MAREPIVVRRAIHLASPYMRGADVAAVQRRTGVKVVDGIFGPVSASGVARWKHYAGYPANEINNGLGVRGQRILFQHDPLPPAYRARAVARRKAGAAQVNVAERAVDIMAAWAKAGYKERPAGSNVVPELVALARNNGVTYMPGMGFPWCEWAANLAALLAGGKGAREGMVDRKWNVAYTVTAVVNAQAGRFHSRLVSPASAPKGAKVYFDWTPGGAIVEHVGRLLRIEGREVVTVEGNTSVNGSQDNGGAVLVRRRPLSQVKFAVVDS